ncbi:MAG: DUF2461 domain-containing protein [Bacteroidota bacterium]
MKSESIQTYSIQFLKSLAKNNNRDWFNANKEKYLAAQENLAQCVDHLILEMNKHDDIENESGKKSLFRIYNDVRFSKDKAPYNARFAFALSRSTKLRRGSYYLSIKPGNSFLACGFFGPNPSDLKLIRDQIAANPDALQKILKSKSIVKNFGALHGDKVATVPRGFDVNQKGIDLIRHKQFILRHTFNDEEILSKDFLKQVNLLFKSQRPFLDYMSEILSTNINGESLYE